MGLTQDDLKKLEKEGAEAILWLEQNKYEIPPDLMSHPLFENSAGFIYCISKEEMERFFASIRRDLNGE